MEAHQGTAKPVQVVTLYKGRSKPERTGGFEAKYVRSTHIDSQLLNYNEPFWSLGAFGRASSGDFLVRKSEVGR